MNASDQNDEGIRSTDNDAAQARLSAVRKGYLTDDQFIQLLVPRARFVPDRPPLINVGTFVRSTAIDSLVNDWISAAKLVQVVSLGAGSDTRFWRLAVTTISHPAPLNCRLSDALAF